MIGRPLSRHARNRARTTRIARLAGLLLIAASLLMPAAPVIAAEPGDMVLQWNAKALVAIGNAPTATPPGLGQAPPLPVIQLARSEIRNAAASRRMRKSRLRVT